MVSLQILKEIGRGQHGQVRLGQDVSSLEGSRVASAGSNINAEGVVPRYTTGGYYHERSRSRADSLSEDHHSIHGTPSGSGGKYWAIKILDRQPRRKLPGVKKLSGFPALAGEAKQISMTNEKLRKEIAILKKCRHPNVVRLREVIDAPASKKIYLGKLIQAEIASTLVAHADAVCTSFGVL